MTTKIKFGTDGWRAVIAEDYTFDNVRICAAATARYLSDVGLAGRGLTIGYDTRFGSERFAEAVATVVAAHGIKVFLCDRPAPTPTISFALLDRNAGGAVVVTASHNPAEWNGYKYKPDYAGSASPEVVAALEERIEQIQAEGGAVANMPLKDAIDRGLVEVFDPEPAYMAQMAKLVDLEAIKKAGLKIIADPMFGAGIDYYPRLLAGGASEVIEINGYRNPLFPGMHNPEPIDHNLNALRAAIVKHGADVGLANDGDADRIGVMDERGVFINQLQVYGLLLMYLLEVRGMRGPVVKTMTTTVMARKLAEQYGLDVYETPVGFKYVGPKMMETGAIMGGEESGGFGFKGHIPERDGIIAGLFILDLMVKLGKKPSELITHLYDQVGPHYYQRIDSSFPAERRDEIVARVRDTAPKSVAGLAVTEIDTQDGFRYFLEGGSWLLIRFSGTEPIIRVYTETTSEDKVSQILKEGMALTGLDA
jgi:alpha-D-glucose phosphate-specific phosphoglucomutase